MSFSPPLEDEEISLLSLEEEEKEEEDDNDDDDGLSTALSEERLEITELLEPGTAEYSEDEEGLSVEDDTPSDVGILSLLSLHSKMNMLAKSKSQNFLIVPPRLSE